MPTSNNPQTQNSAAHWANEARRQQHDAIEIELRSRRLDNSKKAAAASKEWLRVVNFGLATLGGAAVTVSSWVHYIYPFIEHLLR